MPDEPSLPARDPFPAWSTLLAERYDYLTRGLIRYRGLGALGEGWTLEATLEEETRVYALLADPDNSTPYTARFLGVPYGLNEAFTRQTDLQVVLAWPTPTMHLAPAPGRGEEATHVAVGDDRAARPVDVQLKRAGNAQLWWTETGAKPGDPGSASSGAGPAAGLIWEAVLEPGLPAGPVLEEGASKMDPRKSALARWLWSECESFLQRRGQRACITTRRDPAYGKEAFERFLREHGYRHLQQGNGENAPVWARKALAGADAT